MKDQISNAISVLTNAIPVLRANNKIEEVEIVIRKIMLLVEEL